MAARKQKLKVYCTPVGFHDAYVAAPSQKAALEAWGAKTNLFAQGAAETVTDARLTKAPLQHPGEVIKVLRGSDVEQLAALERMPSRKRPTSSPGASRHPLPRERVKGPKPSRAKVVKAEEALQVLEERQAKALARIDQQQRELDRKRRELEQRQAEEIAAAKLRIEEEQERYSEAVRNWEKGD